jgi:hypothetical protein
VLAVYTLRYNGALAGGVEFDWDDENRKHLAAHKVSFAEFGQLLFSDPVDRSLGLLKSWRSG